MSESTLAKESARKQKELDELQEKLEIEQKEKKEIQEKLKKEKEDTDTKFLAQ